MRRAGISVAADIAVSAGVAVAAKVSASAGTAVFSGMVVQAGHAIAFDIIASFGTVTVVLKGYIRLFCRQNLKEHLIFNAHFKAFSFSFRISDCHLYILNL